MAYCAALVLGTSDFLLDWTKDVFKILTGTSGGLSGAIPHGPLVLPLAFSPAFSSAPLLGAIPSSGIQVSLANGRHWQDSMGGKNKVTESPGSSGQAAGDDGSPSYNPRLDSPCWSCSSHLPFTP